MNEPSFADFAERWRSGLYPSEWRRGQALFNLLHDARPDLARELSGALIDPFYSDRNIVAAMCWIAERWTPLRPGAHHTTQRKAER